MCETNFDPHWPIASLAELNHPFKIKFMDMKDFHRSISGFKFRYTGTEPSLDIQKIDDIFRLIDEHNNKNPSFADPEKANAVFCPMLMDYHHRLEGLLIYISTDYDTWNEMTYWTIRVYNHKELYDHYTRNFQTNNCKVIDADGKEIKDVDQTDRANCVPIVFNKHFVQLKPPYFLEYALKLADTLCQVKQLAMHGEEKDSQSESGCTDIQDSQTVPELLSATVEHKNRANKKQQIPKTDSSGWYESIDSN